MPTIIEQLQQDVLNPAVPVSALLRRVKLAAAKLGIVQVEDWVDAELNGYGNQKLPEYRIAHGSFQCFNPMRGWIPVLGDPHLIESLSCRGVWQSISSLEILLDGGGTEMLIEAPPSIVAELDNNSEIRWGRYALIIGRGVVVSIIDRVRTLVLEWALELEGQNILGSEFSFTADEKRKAQEGHMTINIGDIGSFAGNIGSGNTAGAICVSNVDVKQVKELVSQVEKHLHELVAAGADEKRLKENLAALRREVTSSKAEKGTIASLLTDLRVIATGAAGNLVASGIMAALNAMGVPLG